MIYKIHYALGSSIILNNALHCTGTVCHSRNSGTEKLIPINSWVRLTLTMISTILWKSVRFYRMTQKPMKGKACTVSATVSGNGVLEISHHLLYEKTSTGFEPMTSTVPHLLVYQANWELVCNTCGS